MDQTVLEETPQASTAFDPGPFHGHWESYARIHSWLTLVEAGAFLVFPWLLAAVDVHFHPWHSYSGSLSRVTGAHPFLKLVLLDFSDVVTAAGYLQLYRSLSTKIAQGGAEAAFLDRVRLNVATTVQGVVILAFCTWIFTGLHSR